MIKFIVFLILIICIWTDLIMANNEEMDSVQTHIRNDNLQTAFEELHKIKPENSLCRAKKEYLMNLMNIINHLNADCAAENLLEVIDAMTQFPDSDSTDFIVFIKDHIRFNNETIEEIFKDQSTDDFIGNINRWIDYFDYKCEIYMFLKQVSLAEGLLMELKNFKKNICYELPDLGDEIDRINGIIDKSNAIIIDNTGTNVPGIYK